MSRRDPHVDHATATPVIGEEFTTWKSLALLAAFDHLAAFFFAIGLSVQVVALPFPMTAEYPFSFLVFPGAMTSDEYGC